MSAMPSAAPFAAPSTTSSAAPSAVPSTASPSAAPSAAPPFVAPFAAPSAIRLRPHLRLRHLLPLRHSSYCTVGRFDSRADQPRYKLGALRRHQLRHPRHRRLHWRPFRLSYLRTISCTIGCATCCPAPSVWRFAAQPWRRQHQYHLHHPFSNLILRHTRHRRCCSFLGARPSLTPGRHHFSFAPLLPTAPPTALPTRPPAARPAAPSTASSTLPPASPPSPALSSASMLNCAERVTLRCKE